MTKRVIALTLAVALGLLADRAEDGIGHFTAIAAAAAWLRLYASLFRYTAAARQHPHDNRPLGRREIPVAFFAGLSGAIPFLALLGPGLGAAVPLLLLYSVLDIGDAIIEAARRRRQ